MSRWTPRPIDALPARELSRVTLAAATAASEGLVGMRPSPRELVRRWERSPWSVEEIRLDADAEAWSTRVPPQLRRSLRSLLDKFVIGEYTAVDYLPHVMRGAPDEDSLLYLATQAADEARHAAFMARICSELLDGEVELGANLERAWSSTTPAMRALTLLEARIVDDLAASPGDRVRWLRLVTAFHLLTEGVLAVNGQRAIVRALGRTSLLPGVRAGFVAMTRDEGRHLSFGVHALRHGVREGHGEAIWDVVEQALEPLVLIDQRGAAAQPDRTAIVHGRLMARTLLARLRALDASDRFVAHVRSRAEATLTRAAGALAG